MKIIALIGTVAGLAAAPLSAQTIFDTDIGTPALGTPGVTTATTPNGTTTTSSGARATGTPNSGWYSSDVGGGGTTGVTKIYTKDGNGAAYFATTSGASKADLRHNLGPVLLSSLSSVSYDVFRSSSSTVGAQLTPVLRFDIYKGSTFAGSLVLESIYQNNPQTNPPVDQWTTLTANLTNGIFWATNGALGVTFAQEGGKQTLAQWIAANSTSMLYVTGMSIGVGSGWNGTAFGGAVDHVAFDFTGGPSANYDFAVASVPEPATWGLMIGGFGIVGSTMRRRRTALAA